MVFKSLFVTLYGLMGNIMMVYRCTGFSGFLSARYICNDLLETRLVVCVVNWKLIL